MSKVKNPKDLMAARNPLRKPVEPVDIYSQTAVEVPTEGEQPTTSQKPAPKAANAKPSETPRPYSTYLYPNQTKSIRLRAVERDMKDMEIVQEAINEYFTNHPKPD